ncbi:DUF6099 family protein [Streptomyces sp. NPDC088725]|uniref:DUF6099 family protein n=1 Tax=Streptomyces sp. NPDC088725 TaxID=3365873 RepID=UPI00380D45F3
MDAERLVGMSLRALATSADALGVLAEAWQAQALVRAIGDQLALRGPPELTAEARELGETGGRGCGSAEHPVVRVMGVRAGRLSTVSDAAGALTALTVLLREVGIMLVEVACETDEEALYWQCMEAIDAADESSRQVAGTLSKLTSRGWGRERDGSS